MKLETLALIGFLIINGAVVLLWGIAVIAGAIATFPFGLPVLAVLGLFLAVYIGVVIQRLGNKEDDYYEKNIKE